MLTGPPKTSYAARNRAAGAARGQILAFCDADCRPDPEWLKRGTEAIANADLVAGQVVFSPPLKRTAWTFLTLDMFLDQERNVQFSRAATANVFVRRALFERLRGFDETLPSGGDFDFTQRAVSHGGRLAYSPSAIIRHPTLNSWRTLLRKVWFTNHWAAVRSARAGRRPEFRTLLEFLPLVGVALARRRAFRPIASLCRSRLAAAGVAGSWRSDLRAMPLLYLIVAHVAGAARIFGYLRGRREAVAIRSQPGDAPSYFQSTGPLKPRVRRHPVQALPNLVVIGGQKCGTTALHYYLGLHPEIFMSRPKELNFFISKRNWYRGPEWYARHFPAATPVRGESSPNYTAAPFFDGVPERMASLIPDARLIYLVRDPVERIASHWVHNYAQRREKGDLKTTLVHPRTSFVTRSLYHLQLQRFRDHFADSQILVIDSADLRHRRLHTLRRVFEFVGVDSNFIHPNFVHPSVEPHHSADKRRATPLGMRLRRLRRMSAGRRVPAHTWRALEVAFRLSHPFDVSADVAEALGEDVLNLLREDAERLRLQTGLPLEHWSVFHESDERLVAVV